MTPFRLPVQSTAEDVYNKKHAEASKSIDQAIAKLKSRFLCLLGTKPLHYKPAKAAKIVKVCAALHNVCIEYNTDSIDDNGLVGNNEKADECCDIDNVANKPTVEASKKREQMKLSLFS